MTGEGEIHHIAYIDKIAVFSLVASLIGLANLTRAQIQTQFPNFLTICNAVEIKDLNIETQIQKGT